MQSWTSGKTLRALTVRKKPLSGHQQPLPKTEKKNLRKRKKCLKNIRRPQPFSFYQPLLISLSWINQWSPRNPRKK